MGNNATKESRPPHPRAPDSRTQGSSADHDTNALTPSLSNVSGLVYPTRTRSSGQELFPTGGAALDAALEPRKETKQEREVRKAEKERTLRARERERSLKEEGVDGGYLVTLGTYTGTEDFSKSAVRQLMIERRIAPFWRGLNDHSDSWTEHQLVAVARGLPVPAPDEPPPEDSAETAGPFAQPIPVRGGNYRGSEGHGGLMQSATSPTSPHTGSSPFSRGRSKAIATLTSKTGSQPDLAPQELRLPPDPFVNGQPLEAYLYKDASECPICFLYYPPYLNRTRCCDQPICSECFVQIKRPDPHPPEHADPTASAPPETQSLTEEGLLVSEPAQCPFCVQPEFGVSYEPPPFRRGLTYANQAGGVRSSSFVKTGSPMSSSPSGGLSASFPGRQRAASLSANAPQVITTDRVRPDWAKKLSDARAQATRRAAAATALHNAAYLLGGAEGSSSRLGFGRRRRMMIDSAGGGRPGVPIPNMEMLLSALENQVANSSEVTGESRVRRAERVLQQDLEEVMLMEAIRQSLASEDERRKREEKEVAKNAKKDEKARAKEQKEQKKAEKAAKKVGVYQSGNNGSGSFYGASAGPSLSLTSPADDGKGKGKIRAADGSGEDFSTGSTMSAMDDVSNSPARLRSQTNSSLNPSQPLQGSRLRHMSDASSTASSFLESGHGSNEALGSDSSSFNHSANVSGQHLPAWTQPMMPSQSQDSHVSAQAFSGNIASEPTSPSVTNPPAGYQSLAAMMVKEQVKEGAGHGIGGNIQQNNSSTETDMTQNESTRMAQPMSAVSQDSFDVQEVLRSSRSSRDRDQKHHGDVSVHGHGFEETATQ